MSRIGKLPITIPEGVTVTSENGQLTVKGKTAELSRPLHPLVTVTVTDGVASVTVKRPQVKSERALWGTFGSLLKNMVIGVTTGFEKKLAIQGVGYNWKVSGKKLTINAGYSHPVDLEIPEGVTATVDDQSLLVIAGADNQLVGEFAAIVRKVRKPEPYKGTGIRYEDEHIARKAGKQSAGGE